MCNMATAALAVSVIGTGMSAYSQYQQGEAANRQAEYQSQIAANNALIAQRNADAAERDAKYAEAKGEANASAQRRKVAAFIGAQRAAAGASGAVADTGSMLDLNLDTARSGELDALALLDEGRTAAWRARVQGANYTGQASNYLTSSSMYRNTQTNPLVGAGGTLLSGAGTAGMNYYMMTKR